MYIKSLDGVDQKVLAELITTAMQAKVQRYPSRAKASKGLAANPRAASIPWWCTSTRDDRQALAALAARVGHRKFSAMRRLFVFLAVVVLGIVGSLWIVRARSGSWR